MCLLLKMTGSQGQFYKLKTSKTYPEGHKRIQWNYYLSPVKDYIKVLCKSSKCEYLLYFLLKQPNSYLPPLKELLLFNFPLFFIINIHSQVWIPKTLSLILALDPTKIYSKLPNTIHKDNHFHWLIHSNAQ